MSEKPKDPSQVKVAVIGSGGVGKSAVTVQFIQGKFLLEYDPTIEDSYHKQVHVDEEQAMLDVLDTAGQEEYRSLRDQYIRTCDAFLIVYSIIDRKTFEGEIEEVISSIKRVKDAERCHGVLFGNKCDLESNREVQAAEGKALADEFGLTFMEGSAKLYKNIDEAFFELVRIVRKERGWVSKKPNKGKTTKKEPVKKESGENGGDTPKKCQCCTML